MIQLVQDILIGSLAVQHGVLLENNTEYDDCRNRLDLYLDGFVHSLMGSESKEVIAQQEGNAILRLMIEDGFPASVIASAFTSNERMQNIHKDDIHTHIETVLNKCKSIKAAYDDIKNFSVDKFDNFARHWCIDCSFTSGCCHRCFCSCCLRSLFLLLLLLWFHFFYHRRRG